MISWLLEIDHFAQIKRTNKKNKLGHHIEINKLSCENSFLLRNVLFSAYKNHRELFDEWWMKNTIKRKYNI